MKLWLGKSKMFDVRWVLIFALLLVGCGDDATEAAPTDMQSATDTTSTGGIQAPDGTDASDDTDTFDFGALVFTGMSSRPTFQFDQSGEWVLSVRVRDSVDLTTYVSAIGYNVFVRFDDQINWTRINGHGVNLFGPALTLQSGQAFDLRLTFDGSSTSPCPPQSEWWVEDLQIPRDEERCVEWGINTYYQVSDTNVYGSFNVVEVE